LVIRGTAKAIVLPEPVLPLPKISLPEIAAGIVACWIGKGDTAPI
jgi:hypothetical protein